MQPKDIIKQPLNSSIEEWCNKQREKNKERVLMIMHAAGISREEAVKVKSKEDDNNFTNMVNREIKRKNKRV